MKCHGSVPLIHVFLLKDIGGLRGAIMVCLALGYCFSIYSKVETMEEYEMMLKDLHQR